MELLTQQWGMAGSYAAFCLFVVAMTGTPGPGNLAMMAIGQATGFRSAVPFLLGTTVGCTTLNTVVACGLGQLFLLSPALNTVMRVVGTAYILYLGWKVLHMQIGAPAERRGLSFRDGVFVHPLSPKSWGMSVAAVSQFTDPAAPLWPKAAVFVLTFMAGQVCFHSLWGLAGANILGMLRGRAARVGLNMAMVLFMVGATVWAMFA